METRSTALNETFSKFSLDSDLDMFHDIYSDQALNQVCALIYIFGFVGWFGIILVSYFEKSGLAGPFRTFANQLVSYNLDQVKI